MHYSEIARFVATATQEIPPPSPLPLSPHYIHATTKTSVATMPGRVENIHKRAHNRIVSSDEDEDSGSDTSSKRARLNGSASIQVRTSSWRPQLLS
jgi:hypothetical protein